MILYLQKILLAAVVAAAISASTFYITNASHSQPGLQAPLRVIHTAFSSQLAKIEQNIFTLWSTL